MIKLLIGLIIGLFSIIFGLLYSLLPSNESVYGGKKPYNKNIQQISTIWFDPRLFASRKWKVSTNNRKFHDIKCKNNTEWKNMLAMLAKESEIDDIDKLELYFDPVDPYLRNSRSGASIRIPTMKWRSYHTIPHVRETEYLRKYQADKKAILGENSFLMTPFLREWQKNNILKHIPHNPTIFDIGIGTGRSKELWDAKNAVAIWGVEPNEDNISQLRKKYIKNLHVQPWGGEDSRIREWAPSQTFDVVMMSYSITFFFENKERLSDLLTNVDYLLKPGGVFIVIGMDGGRVKKFSKKNVVDNDLFTIKFNDKKDKDKSVFSNEIEITMKSPFSLVESQKEYLVNFDTLEQELENMKYKEVEKKYVEAPFYLSEWPKKFSESQKLIVYRK